MTGKYLLKDCLGRKIEVIVHNTTALKILKKLASNLFNSTALLTVFNEAAKPYDLTAKKCLYIYVSRREI